MTACVGRQCALNATVLPDESISRLPCKSRHLVERLDPVCRGCCVSFQTRYSPLPITTAPILEQGVEEASASFEARYAPLSYPTTVRPAPCWYAVCTVSVCVH